MIARLKILLDEPRGSAWPPSARTVRRALKWANERDPRLYLLLPLIEVSTIERPLAMSQRKVWATIGQYAPNLLGYTWATMVWTMGCNLERGSQSPKPYLSSDWGLELALMKVKSLVIAVNETAVNMSPLLALTARQARRVGMEWGTINW